MENPFWNEENHIRKLELELVTTDDLIKKKQIEILLNHAEDDLEKKKKAYYKQRDARRDSDNDVGMGCGWWLLGFFFAFPFAIIGWIILKIMKRNREASSLGWGIFTGILAAILLAVILIVFNLFILDTANKFTNSAIDNIQTTQTVNSSSSIPFEKNSKITDVEDVKSKNLSEDEAIDWVKAYLNESGKLSKNDIAGLIFGAELKKDNLLYITARTKYQNYALFRIDEYGNLQENSDFYGMSNWEIVRTSKDYNEDSKKEIVAANEKKQRADAIRALMEKNQGFDANILASISDDEILKANAGTATNSAVAQTAKNLLDKYPNLTN